MPGEGNLYQTLIEAALARLEATGSMPGTLAELAELAEVPLEDVSGIFGSLQNLREGLIYQGIALLNDSLRQGVVHSGSVKPDAQLRSLARSYAIWASRNPALFRVIVDGMNRPMPEGSTLYRFTMSMRDLFERKLREMRDLGLIRHEADLAAILLVILCVVKGANVLLLNRKSEPWLRDDPRPVAQIADEMFGYLIDNLLITGSARAA